MTPTGVKDPSDLCRRIYDGMQDPGPDLSLPPWKDYIRRTLVLDGYGTDRARMDPDDLVETADTTCHILRLDPGMTVFENSIGAGATALAIQRTGRRISGGADISDRQIGRACHFLPDLAEAGRLYVGSAAEFAAPFQSDGTIGWGLGMYLNGLAELRRVFQNMMAGTRPGGVVSLVEFTTAEYADSEWHLRARDQAAHPEPLEHFYPSETQVRRVLEDLGLRHIFFWRQYINLYPHNNRMCVAGWLPEG
jgi:hypothetical protein